MIAKALGGMRAFLGEAQALALGYRLKLLLFYNDGSILEAAEAAVVIGVWVGSGLGKCNAMDQVLHVVSSGGICINNNYK